MQPQIVELADWDGLPQIHGNVARRRLTFEGRQVLPAHKHNFAHAHIVVRGTIRCTLFDEKWSIVSVNDYPAPAMFGVPADYAHQLSAVTDGAEGWCIFAVRNEDGGVAYEVTEAHKKDHFWHERLGAGDTLKQALARILKAAWFIVTLPLAMLFGPFSVGYGSSSYCDKHPKDVKKDGT